MKKVYSIIIFCALCGWGRAQVTEFKKVERFGLEWISKKQTILPSQSLLLPANSFIEETIQGQMKINKVGGVMQIFPIGRKPLVIIWLSLVTLAKEEEFTEKEISRNLKVFRKN